MPSLVSSRRQAYRTPKAHTWRISGATMGIMHSWGVKPQAASLAAVRGGLLIALCADVFAAEEVWDVVDIVPGKAMAVDVVTAGGTL